MEKHATPTNYGALTTLTTVFFFWGFIAAGNSIFIPFCKHYFHLDQFQSQLIDFAFYGAYYLGALGLFIFSSQTGRDLVGTWGYKRSIVYGLLFSALGAVAMIISVYFDTFTGMLFGLFIVALGFSLQQTSANPFMISLGDEKTGSNRVSFGGGINSFGTLIGPIIVALALFGSFDALKDEETKQQMIATLSLKKVIILYACVGSLFLGIALLFRFSRKLPSGIADDTRTSIGQQVKSGRALATLLIITGLLFGCLAPVFSSYNSDEEKQLVELQQDIDTVFLDEQGEKIAHPTEQQYATEKALVLEKEKILRPLDKKRIMWLSAGLAVILGGLLFANVRGTKQKEGWGAMQYPQLTLGMLAIFFYVGVEVAIGSNLGALLERPAFGGFEHSEITPFVSMFWGSLMIGRWTASVNVFNMKKQSKTILQFIVPLVAFGIILTVFAIIGFDPKPFYWYIICVLIQIAASFLTKDRPAFTLTVFGILGTAALVTGLLTTGITAVFAFLSAGLFCSIMWPCIFSLSLAGLGKYQAQGSAFLVMMILGGAIIPPLQGKLADIVGIQGSFFVGAVCFIYITFFAVYVNRLLKKQGVSLDESSAAH
jgi:FHS family L-fucose permease-like MFS transporter